MSIKVKRLFSTIGVVAFLTLGITNSNAKSFTDSFSDNKALDEKKPNWTYSEKEDLMTNQKKYYALSTSTNRIKFEFPYEEKEGSSFKFTIRNIEKTNSILLSVSKGHFLYSSGFSKSVRVKFDDEEPVYFKYNMVPGFPDDDIVSLSDADTFIAKLKKAKKLLIGVVFYKTEEQVISFDVAGLKWEH